MSLTQKALVVFEIGSRVVLINDRPVSQPQPNQVQLKVTVAGINPHDQKGRDHGIHIVPHLPAVITNDVVGKVTKLGKGVKGIEVGDRIVSHATYVTDRTQNGLQEYALADISASAKIPDSITDDEAATLPSNLIPPVVAIFKVLKIPAPWSLLAKDFDYANTMILIVGGGSNCGRFGVQVAKLAGIGKIVVVGGSEAELVSYGATHVIDRHGDNDVVLGRIRDVVADDLLYAFDTVNYPDGQILALNALSNSKRGAMARLLPTGPVDDSKVHGKMAGFDVRGVFGSSHMHPEITEKFWELIPDYLETGKIRPLKYVVKHGLDASIVNEVLDNYRDGKPVTKTHIHL